ncbi:hypothetical protein HID58_006713 [Brassica napus]|uniref:Secreted protein n=1 Tax=Brassica napus TaxID=3708 RepID=A0ABQ8EC66_BRANA|nr:hypothetical protein HID58_006713 [Brassica napus]
MLLLLMFGLIGSRMLIQSSCNLYNLIIPHASFGLCNYESSGISVRVNEQANIACELHRSMITYPLRLNLEKKT